MPELNEEQKKELEEKRLAEEKQKKESEETDKKGKETTTPRSPEVEKLIAEEVEKALKDMKKQLAGLSTQRDDALAMIEKGKAEARAAEIKRLEAEGKKAEALELKLAEANAKLKVLEESNTSLSRDATVRQMLNDLQFRNDKARQIAVDMITQNLVKNEKGQWVHTSGISVQDFITAFAKEEDNSFLFKSKQSSGSGTASVGENTGNTNQSKSLFTMSQTEVLDMIRKKHNI